MGIRFHCSACERKLNVKAFLAGRRGLCPYCGASIQIPSESARPSAQQLQDRQPTQPKREQPDAGPGQPAQPQGPAPAAKPPDEAAQAGAEQAASPLAGRRSGGGTLESGATEAPAGRPKEPAAKTRPQAAGPSSVEPSGLTSAEAAPAPLAAAGLPAAAPSPIEPAAAAGPSSPAAPEKADLRQAGPQAAASPPQSPPTAAKATDPLAEAPDAVWYVRPPSGGQFGPATRDTMQSWLAEGRVSADALVWREGWRDWRQATGVFPQLATGQMESALASLATSEPSSSVQTSHGGRPTSHRQPTTTHAVIIVLLVVAVVVLLGVLIWVLSGGPASLGDASTQLPAWAASAVQRGLTAICSPWVHGPVS